ncbi:MAG TPA: hypothetical protein PK054_02805 [Anaerohalosphaeraceae bacterium]|nr:hypothetical protein [Anaerohalosphaeraceae bacterium]HOL87992.1 hypothetical protein [Anaerohalosphaeraceae bacterium]HPP55491.1 hypothetical protein [Anaerohalosphaeraceae bacterium]
MRFWKAVLLLCLGGVVRADLVTEDLIIHLKADALTGLADGGAVTVWPDSATGDSVDGTVRTVSGYGTPTYKTNQINGKPAVRFVRAEQDVMVSYQWVLPNPSAGLTIFIVCTGGSSGSVERAAQIGAAAGTASRMMAVDVSSGSSGCRFNNGYALSPAGSNPISAGVYHIGIRRMAQGGRHDSLYYAVNDLIAEPLTCNNPANVMTFDSAGNHLSIGNGVDTAGAWWPDFYNGDLAEILVYNAQLSLQQISQTAEYLSTKYGIPFQGASILVSESGGNTTVREGGGGDTIEAALTFNPGAYPVTVRAEDVLNPAQVQVLPTERVFTSSDWQSPQSFTVAALDDDQMERAVHDTKVKLMILTDPSSPYYGISLNPVWVNIEDNDCGSLGFSPADFNLDCRVDLEDFSIFVVEWLGCNIPDPTCQNFAG